MKYIIVSILLTVLALSVLFVGGNIPKMGVNRPLKDIPKVEIIKEFNFSISQDRYKNILFSGDFNSTDSAKEIVELLKDFKLNSKIALDSSLRDNREVIIYTKRIIKKLIDGTLLEWSIVYRDRKLLIEGKSFNGDIKRAIDTTMLLSNITYFNNIKSIEDRELEVIKRLKEVIPKDLNREHLDREMAEDIILSLKDIVERDLPSNIRRKTIKRIVKRRNQKGSIAKVSTPKSKRHFKYNRNIKIDMERVDLNSSDIMSLPYVKFVEREEPFNIKKHVIDEGTVYIPPSKPDEIEPKDIPWAKLYDLNEKIR